MLLAALASEAQRPKAQQNALQFNQKNSAETGIAYHIVPLSDQQPTWEMVPQRQCPDTPKRSLRSFVSGSKRHRACNPRRTAEMKFVGPYDSDTKQVFPRRPTRAWYKDGLLSPLLRQGKNQDVTILSARCDRKKAKNGRCGFALNYSTGQSRVSGSERIHSPRQRSALSPGPCPHPGLL